MVNVYYYALKMFFIEITALGQRTHTLIKFKMFSNIIYNITLYLLRFNIIPLILNIFTDINQHKNKSSIILKWQLVIQFN